MTLDHLAWAFLPTVSAGAFLLHLVGRAAAPVMCFFIAEGYRRTHSLRRYALRLAAAALVSAVPYSLFLTGRPFARPFSVLWTLLLGLLAVAVWDRVPAPLPRFAALAALLALALPGDWGVWGAAWCVVFFALRADPRRGAAAFALLVLARTQLAALTALLGGDGFGAVVCLGLVQAGSLLALPLLALYNGRAGGGRAKRGFFYLYYPLHLALLAAARWGGSAR